MTKSVLDVEKVMTQLGYNQDKIQHVIAHGISGDAAMNTTGEHAAPSNQTMKE